MKELISNNYGVGVRQREAARGSERQREAARGSERQREAIWSENS